MKKRLLGIALMLVSVFVVGNVSAKTYDETDISYGAVTDKIENNKEKYVTNNGKYSSEVIIDKNEESGMQYKNVIINVKEADLNFLKKGDVRTYDSAWVGFVVTLPKIENKTIKDANHTIKGTYSLNGGAEKEFFNGKGDSFDEGADDYNGDFIAGVTVERLQDAVKNGGTLTFAYTIKWEVTEEKSKTTGTFEQKVTINVDTTKLTITNSNEDFNGDATERIIWSPKIASDYKASLPATTPAEETTPTEESGKDSQPKTGEGIPMALVGMMTLGLAGAYTFKKS